MDISLPLPLLGGLSAAQFMRRHWQKKPLLVRGAVPEDALAIGRDALFGLVAQDGVESRLVEQRDAGSGWRVRPGPFARRSLPPLSRAAWTLLVQGVDQHLAAAHDLLQRFRFVPDVRLDDLMVSYATDGGGVGPHFDSYDVFLLQARGTRRWHIGRQRDLSLRSDTPLKVLAHFEPEESFLLEPGDMLYLPPRYAHDGVAEGECMTCSIGFRAPSRDEMAREVLLRLMDAPDDGGDERVSPLYRDASQPAVAAPGAIPDTLHAFAEGAIAAALAQPGAVARALGEYLTEPKPHVWFEASQPVPGAPGAGIVLDARTRMAYDARHVFINGESYRASGRDARLMHLLADERRLGMRRLGQASAGARDLVDEWLSAGWVHVVEDLR